MLDYLKNVSAPGTMPSAIPAGPSPDILSAIQPGGMQLDPAQLAAVQGPTPGMMPMPMQPPPKAQYQAVTQDDDSVLLHLVNADGSLGPAVKIIPPLKPKSQSV
jgi:hypothetical protein